MPPLEEEQLFPSTPGKIKIERPAHHHPMNRGIHRCFASTFTMFLWALLLIALTASYLSIQSFVDSGGRYIHRPVPRHHVIIGGPHWEKQIRSSAQIHRPHGLVGSRHRRGRLRRLARRPGAEKTRRRRCGG
ncbi:hypothetical protein SSX86_026274 [Deinandra increscens subsp. villosa]|uniref:Uncharacterized protein n=1 Tax=Deinandra increscens subsp. villosa TaxID=3103831 RepID=A0AAP0CK21_9ASTR